MRKPNRVCSKLSAFRFSLVLTALGNNRIQNNFLLINCLTKCLKVLINYNIEDNLLARVVQISSSNFQVIPFNRPVSTLLIYVNLESPTRQLFYLMTTLDLRYAFINCFSQFDNLCVLECNKL